jgi:substrate import-associated zinc metallohydrolase lipoprotein
MKSKIIYIMVLVLAILAGGCYEEDPVSAPIKTHTPSKDELDQYIDENFVEEYGVAVRYKFVDRYVDPTKRVTPPSLEVVKPMLDFLMDFWIEPFSGVANGDDFFRQHVPAEVVFIGSLIYNTDGTVTLGVADAGARITLTEVNNIDPDDLEWIYLQLQVIYHEFAHIMHQRYNLPPNWQGISPEGYTSSGSWYNLTDEEALQRGFVSPYATSSFNEDFAELVAFLLYHPDFFQNYIEDEVCTTSECNARNAGRAKIRTKYNSVISHYKQNTGVDLLKVRELIQAKL